MAFFYSFTESLKQKWLQFFQANHDWIKLHMQVESVYTPDGGKRPPSYLILGVVNALEPKLAQLMLPFSKLNADADTLIEVLGLNFDPDVALGNSTGYGETAVNYGDDQDSPMDTSGFAEVAMTQGFSMESSPEDLDEEMEDEISPVSSTEEVLKSDKHQAAAMDSDDEFGDVSFDGDVSFADQTPEDSSLADFNTSGEETGFGDVLMDVWGEESNSAAKNDEDNDMLLGEEFATGAFDDSEIARLFPNA